MNIGRHKKLKTLKRYEKLLIHKNEFFKRKKILTLPNNKKEDPNANSNQF